MDTQNSFGAGRVILIAFALAVLLYWIDSWSHSLPMMAFVAVAGLAVFFFLRRPDNGRPLSPGERLELEREAAREWMRQNDDPVVEDPDDDSARPN